MWREITLEMSTFVLVMVVIPGCLFVVGYYGTLLLDRVLDKRGNEHARQRTTRHL